MTLQRFHRFELASLVVLALMAGAAWMLYLAFALVNGASASSVTSLTSLQAYLLTSGSMLTLAVLFGAFLIYPLIRTQVKEQGELRAMTESLSARSQTLEQAALTDALTGMQNRRYFDDALREYLEEFRRIGKPVGLMLLDLDHFKAVNDNHGHDVGDEVLRRVAQCLHEFTRYHDIVARMGGEEFAIVAPNMDVHKLTKFAERIRTAVSELAITSGNVRLRITTSVGLAVWDGEETPEAFYRRADGLLYQAKRRGRNRVCAGLAIKQA